MINRRTLLMAGAALGAIAATGTFGEAGTMTTTATTIDWAKLSDAEWRKRLTPMQYNVLRNHGTERPGSSPLNNEHRKGTFACAGLRPAAVLLRRQVPQRHRLAELL